jgi:ADP-heptose:LPS heptosyltransferase
MLGAIKHSRPDWHVTLACRAGFEEVARLFPAAPDELLPIDFNPYAWSTHSPELLHDLRPVIESFQSRTADIYLSAEMQPTWFGRLLASVIRPSTALCCTRVPEQVEFLSALRRSLGLAQWTMKNVALPERTHELRRYDLLLGAFGIPAVPSFPWPRPPRPREDNYLACFPSGSPGTKVKRWPPARFAEVLREWKARWNLPVLLLGDVSEREELQELAGQIGGAEVLAGAPVTEAAAVLANARLYLGNDTGPMHLASAFGVPGVAIYGGGHWPSYAPWGHGSIGLVSPLPCFGCDWDCVFGRGICVELVPVDEVSAALEKAMCRPGEPEARILRVADPRLEEIVGCAASKYRQLQADRAERLVCLEGAAVTIADQQRGLDHLHSALAGQLSAVQAHQTRIATLESIAAERLAAIEVRDEQIVALELVAAERLADVHGRAEQIANLEAIAAERLAAMQAREDRIANLEDVAAERLAAMQAREARIANLEAIAAERLAAMKARDQETQAREDRIAKLESIAAERLAAGHAREARIASLESIAAERLTGMQLREARIANLESIAAERLTAMQARDRETQAREDRIANLEAVAAERLAAMQARDREIQKREKRIQKLQSAADERLAAMLEMDREIARLERLLATTRQASLPG